MTMTSQVKAELSRVSTVKPCCRKAEVLALLRFAGDLHVSARELVVEAELDTYELARRLRTGLAEVLGQRCDMVVLPPRGSRKSTRYIVRVQRNAATFARRAGLLDSHGRPIQGLHPQVVCWPPCDCAAAWRVAFLHNGAFSGTGRSLEVACPSPAAALALAGTARRLNVQAHTRERHGVDQVTIRGHEVTRLLVSLGAQASALAWEQHQARHAAHAPAGQPSGFSNANVERTVQAARAAAAGVRRALAIVGDDAPEHLLEAGRLRIEHPDISLEELARLATPPLTKNAIAGRIRRLQKHADQRARSGSG
jgi:DNA-binding protein WhiA